MARTNVIKVVCSRKKPSGCDADCGDGGSLGSIGSIDQRDSVDERESSSDVYKQLVDAMGELDHEIDEVSAIGSEHDGGSRRTRGTRAEEDPCESDDDDNNDDDKIVDSPKDLQTTILSLQLIYQNLDATVVELKTKLEEKESAVESLRFQLVALEENRAASLDELKGTVEEKESKIKDLKSMLAALEESRAASLEELTARAEEKESAIGDQRSRLAALEEKRAREGESRDEDLKRQLAALEEHRVASREEKESRIEGLERRLADMEADRDEKDQEVRLLGNYVMRKIEAEEAKGEEEEQGTGAQGPSSDTEDRLLWAVEDLEGRYRRLDAEVAGLGTDVAESKRKIETLESQNSAGKEQRALSKEENARMGARLAEKDREVTLLGNYVMRLLGAEGGGVEVAAAGGTEGGGDGPATDDLESRVRVVEANGVPLTDENARLGEALAEKDREVEVLSNYVMKLLEAQTP